ncbi:MAG: Cobalamin biosynthesis protein CbiB [Rhodocyclaceae bacterium]|nr:MAG: CobD/CbiB family protein [Rhodocyclaceae bacterium]MBV6407406.1 Cobalamin biosynthesis protein CbiB [Rhodocyclaceae bacterium]CAG0926742.1 adenosylcobinamide-phosphate synthase [Rhodocyclaceae bacterium]
MTVLSLIVVLLLEQLRPLSERKAVAVPLSHFARFFEGRFNDGQARHGAIAWLLAVLPATVACAAIHLALMAANPLLGLAWTVAILYLTLGFRQFSHYFTDIHLALRMGETDRARALLGEWRGRSADGFNASEIARLAMEEALVSSHRHVFAVIVWFVLLPGPAGALFYRLSYYFASHWAGRRDGEFGAFGRFAGQAFAVIDWLPVRITAAAFAIVGDFEDAVYCWRTQAARWPDEATGILLASGAGALGVRLGQPIVESGEVTERPELGLGEEADADFMQSGIGLVWRTLVLCLLLLTLLGIASWAG